MFKTDDIVVRLNNSYRKKEPIGQMYKVIGVNRPNFEVISDIDGEKLAPSNNNFRLATLDEVIAYNQGIRNIKDIKLLNYEIY